MNIISVVVASQAQNKSRLEVQKETMSQVPLGLHLTQSAARFSLRITRVGTHSAASRFQT